MPITAVSRVGALRQRVGLTQKVMARLLGVTERTFIDLEAGRELSESVSRRLIELERLYQQLTKVVRPRAIGRWFIQPNTAFDDETPADLIARGKVDLLWQMIFELRSGAAS